MRKILFRGKRVVDDQWVCGDLIHRTTMSGDILVIRVEDSGFDNYIEYEVVPETVGQYTGLTDKRCRKIFDGDILTTQASQYRLKKEFVTVYFDDETHGWSVEFSNGNKCSLWAYKRDNFYLIGNIHDNSELLK